MSWVVACTYTNPTGGVHMLCAHINRDGHATISTSLQSFESRAQAEAVLARFSGMDPLSPHHSPLGIISSDEFFERASTYWTARELGW